MMENYWLWVQFTMASSVERSDKDTIRIFRNILSGDHYKNKMCAAQPRDSCTEMEAL